MIMHINIATHTTPNHAYPHLTALATLKPQSSIGDGQQIHSVCTPSLPLPPDANYVSFFHVLLFLILSMSYYCIIILLEGTLVTQRCEYRLQDNLRYFPLSRNYIYCIIFYFYSINHIQFNSNS